MSLPKFTTPSEEEIEKARKKVFYGNGMYIFRSVIEREDALKIKDLFLIKNPEIFTKILDEGNHRLFFYPESPFWHPPFIKFLWEKICYIRNDLYELTIHFIWVFCEIRNHQFVPFLRAMII